MRAGSRPSSSARSASLRSGAATMAAYFAPSAPACAAGAARPRRKNEVRSSVAGVMREALPRAHLRQQPSAQRFSSRERSSRSAASAYALLQQFLGDRLELHVRRAFVDLADLGVAVELLRREVLGEAGAAEDLERERRRVLGDLGGIVLRHRRLLEERLLRLLQPRRVVDEEARALELRRHSR